MPRRGARTRRSTPRRARRLGRLEPACGTRARVRRAPPARRARQGEPFAATERVHAAMSSAHVRRRGELRRRRDGAHRGEDRRDLGLWEAPARRLSRAARSCLPTAPFRRRARAGRGATAAGCPSPPPPQRCAARGGALSQGRALGFRDVVLGAVVRILRVLRVCLGVRLRLLASARLARRPVTSGSRPAGASHTQPTGGPRRPGLHLSNTPRRRACRPGLPPAARRGAGAAASRPRRRLLSYSRGASTTGAFQQGFLYMAASTPPPPTPDAARAHDERLALRRP